MTCIGALSATAQARRVPSRPPADADRRISRGGAARPPRPARRRPRAGRSGRGLESGPGRRTSHRRRASGRRRGCASATCSGVPDDHAGAEPVLGRGVHRWRPAALDRRARRAHVLVLPGHVARRVGDARPGVGAAPREGHAMHADLDGRRVTTDGLGLVADPCGALGDGRGRGAAAQVAVGDPPGAPHGRLGAGPDPDRARRAADRLGGDVEARIPDSGTCGRRRSPARRPRPGAARRSSPRAGAPRSVVGTPNPSNSSSRQPMPRPRISRPPDSRSTVAASSARRSGSNIGASSTPVPSRIRSVRAATAARTGSWAAR